MSDIQTEIVGQNQPVSGPSESPASLDWGALKAQASTLIDAANTEPASSPVATDPTPETPASVSPEHAASHVTEDPVESSARKALQFNDDDELEIVVDGKTKTVPWKDARSQLSGEFKFTQKMQELARERNELSQQRAAIQQLQMERDQMVALLNNPTAVVQYAQQSGLLSPDTPNADPNEIATIGEVQHTIQQQLARVRQETEAAIAQANASLAFEQEKAGHSVAITSTLSNIFQANPVLNAIPNAEDLIRYQVAQMVTPQTTQSEAIEAFNVVAREMVANIGQHFQTSQKAQRIAEAKQKLVSKSIEPPGGAAPQPKPLNFKKSDGTVDWKVLQGAAAAMLG